MERRENWKNIRFLRDSHIEVNVGFDKKQEDFVLRGVISSYQVFYKCKDFPWPLDLGREKQANRELFGVGQERLRGSLSVGLWRTGSVGL